MFMCNPLEDINFPLDGTPCTLADLGVGVPLKHDCLVGRGMLLKNGGGGQGNTSDYCQGEFGLFDCPDGIVPNTLVSADRGSAKLRRGISRHRGLDEASLTMIASTAKGIYGG